jgi:hypothetical protein
MHASALLKTKEKSAHRKTITDCELLPLLTTPFLPGSELLTKMRPNADYSTKDVRAYEFGEFQAPPASSSIRFETTTRCVIPLPPQNNNSWQKSLQACEISYSICRL